MTCEERSQVHVYLLYKPKSLGTTNLVHSLLLLVLSEEEKTESAAILRPFHSCSLAHFVQIKEEKVCLLVLVRFVFTLSFYQ